MAWSFDTGREPAFAGRPASCMKAMKKRFNRSAHVLRRLYLNSTLSHAAGEFGCTVFLRCVTVLYLLNSYAMRRYCLDRMKWMNSYNRCI